jgi:hypothetical protein
MGECAVVERRRRAAMIPEQFDQALRELIRARPFHPFSVVFADGQTLYVDEPAVAFNNGSAGFIDRQGEVHFIECEQVSEFRMAAEELTK